MRFLIHFFLAVLMGLSISLYVAQVDPHIKTNMQEVLKRIFEKTFDCLATYQLNDISLIPLQLQGTNISISDSNSQTWQWKANQIFVQSSIIHSLLNRNIGLNIELDTLEAFSFLEKDKPSIIDHIKKLVFESTNVPVSLQHLCIHNGLLTLVNREKDMQASLEFSNEFRVIADRLKNILSITNGSCTQGTQKIIDQFTAQFAIEKKNNSTTPPTLFAESTFNLCCVPTPYQHYLCTIDSHAGTTKLLLRNKASTCYVKAIHTYQKQWILDMQIPIAILRPFFQELKDLDGYITLQATYDEEHNSAHVDIKCTHLTWFGSALDDLTVTIRTTSDTWQGIINIQQKNNTLFSGKWHYDMQNASLSGQISNNSPLSLFNTTIESGDICIDLTINTQGVTIDSYNICCYDQFRNKHTLQGSIQYKEGYSTAQGSFDTYTYKLIPDPIALNHTLIISNNQQEIIASCSLDKHFNINGHVLASILKDLLRHYTSIDIKGVGTFVLTGSCNTTTGCISLILTTKDTKLYTHELLNFVKKIQAQINLDIPKKTLTFNNVVCMFHKGTISLQHGVIRWYEKEKNMYVHIPLLLNSVLVNNKRDIFSLLSGILVLEKKDKKIACTGTVTIDQSECKRNILSSLSSFFNSSTESTNDLSIPDIETALTITTKKPIHIKTPFLATDASIHMKIQGSSKNPAITGSILLKNGTIQFPYKALFLTHGLIYLAPHQKNPSIELIAKGMVKKYHVTMRVNGNIKKPSITFESIPALSEEQIIVLLLSGSEVASFATAMPSLIMHNIQQILLASDQSMSKLEGYFSSIIDSLKHIRIIPSFIDQTGRGGFQGALEIDVSEKLHTLIQKNFSLPEDTKFEIEYLLSDEISVRGIKDERGDVGGEIEVRWKF